MGSAGILLLREVVVHGVIGVVSGGFFRSRHPCEHPFWWPVGGRLVVGVVVGVAEFLPAQFGGRGGLIE